MSDSGIAIIVDTQGLTRGQNILRRITGRAPVTAQDTTRAMAVFFLNSVKQHASGRPGPNVNTGAYRGQIVISGYLDYGNGSMAVVESTAPETNRLEMGFVGVDSLGRHYQQPPFPHWRPALVELQKEGPKIMRKMARKMFS